MKARKVSGAKIPHKTRGDAVINTKPICHVTSEHISEVRGQNHGFDNCFRKLVFQGAPTIQLGTRGLLSGWEGFPRLSPPLSPPHMASLPSPPRAHPTSAVPRFLGLVLHLLSTLSPTHRDWAVQGQLESSRASPEKGLLNYTVPQNLPGDNCLLAFVVSTMVCQREEMIRPGRDALSCGYLSTCGGRSPCGVCPLGCILIGLLSKSPNLSEPLLLI